MNYEARFFCQLGEASRLLKIELDRLHSAAFQLGDSMRATHNASHLVAAPGQAGGHGAADLAAGAGDERSHAHGTSNQARDHGRG